MFNTLNPSRVIIFKTMNDFSEFVNRENAKRNWTDSDLARAAKVGKSSISWARSTGKPGAKVSQGIAKAYKMSVEEVYRAAGLLPPIAKEDAQIKRLTHKLENPNLTQEDRDLFEADIDARIHYREGRVNDAARLRKDSRKAPSTE